MWKRSKLLKDREERFPDHWSYSSWSTAHKCAFAYYCRFILGMKEPEKVSPALEHGIEMHRKAEGYLKGDVTSLPKEFKDFKAHYSALRKAKPIIEQFWGVSNRWVPLRWKSWVVMKMDAALEPSKKNHKTLWIQDLKTGREYEDAHQSQSGLYVAIGSSLFPKLERAETEFWYIDQGYPVMYEYSKKMIEQLRAFWSDEGKKLLKPKKEYLPTPTDDGCRWCFLRTDKGGPCDAYKVLERIRSRG